MLILRSIIRGVAVSKKNIKPRRPTNKGIIIDAYEELGSDGASFQDLVHDFFEMWRQKPNQTVDHINVHAVSRLGIGPDDGEDSVVEYTLNDPEFATIKRKVIIQAKFYKKNLDASDLGEVSLPNLLASNGADGYILIVRQNVGTSVGKVLKKLTDNQQDKCFYKFWTGADFFEKILKDSDLVKKYFKDYAKREGII